MHGACESRHVCQVCESKQVLHVSESPCAEQGHRHRHRHRHRASDTDTEAETRVRDTHRHRDRHAQDSDRIRQIFLRGVPRYRLLRTPPHQESIPMIIVIFLVFRRFSYSYCWSYCHYIIILSSLYIYEYSNISNFLSLFMCINI